MKKHRIIGKDSASVRRSGRKQGFTLAELLAVMLIMVILMGMAVGAFYGMGRGARMRGAVSSFNTTLSLSRQYAITRSQPLTIELIESDDTGETVWSYNILYYDNGNNEQQLRPTQYLPPGILFVADNNRFTFRPDGSLEDGNETIHIEDEDGHRITFKINGLTGMIKIEEPE